MARLVQLRLIGQRIWIELFDRARPVEQLILGHVDGAPAALTQHAFDAIAAFDGLADFQCHGSPCTLGWSQSGHRLPADGAKARARLGLRATGGTKACRANRRRLHLGRLRGAFELDPAR